jgi:hypothetical protein
MKKMYLYSSQKGNFQGILKIIWSRSRNSDLRLRRAEVGAERNIFSSTTLEITRLNNGIWLRKKCKRFSPVPHSNPPYGFGCRTWNGVAVWKWLANDDTCGICRVAFDGCCPDCKYAGAKSHQILFFQVYLCDQYSNITSSVADPDPVSGAFLTRGSGIRNGKITRSGSGMNILRLIFEKNT